jgi:hypothetical protein
VGRDREREGKREWGGEREWVRGVEEKVKSRAMSRHQCFEETPHHGKINYKKHHSVWGHITPPPREICIL